MTKEQKVIRAKVGLLELARQLGNVSQACKMMGYSRDSFYRFSPDFPVRPDGAYHQWRRVPPGELSIAPVADERLGRATGPVEAS